LLQRGGRDCSDRIGDPVGYRLRMVAERTRPVAGNPQAEGEGRARGRAGPLVDALPRFEILGWSQRLTPYMLV
jgi:hypothetical protein